MEAPGARDVRVFIPARDFALSLASYRALGWRETWTDQTLAVLDLAGSRLVLQDRYVREWAENAMLTVEVDDASAWATHVNHVLATGGYGDARVSEVRQEEWAQVTYVWDPSGGAPPLRPVPPTTGLTWPPPSQ